jgi:hypothetical protein
MVAKRVRTVIGNVRQFALVAVWLPSEAPSRHSGNTTKRMSIRIWTGLRHRQQLFFQTFDVSLCSHHPLIAFVLVARAIPFFSHGFRDCSIMRLAMADANAKTIGLAYQSTVSWLGMQPPLQQGRLSVSLWPP